MENKELTKIRMTSNMYKIVKIKKKTTAEGFKDFNVGDLILFETEMKYKVNARGGNYASYYKVINISNRTVTVKSQSEMTKIISSVFELEELG